MKMSLMMLLGMAGLASMGTAATWTCDFENDKPSYKLWAEAFSPEACKAEFAQNPQTGKQALKVTCDTTNRSWMHVYALDAKTIKPFSYGKFTIWCSTAAPAKVLQLGLRPMDKDNETFYYYRNVSWNKAGRWQVTFYVDTVNGNYNSIAKHGDISNGEMDFPLNGMGVTFNPLRNSGICEFYLERVEYEEITEKDMPAKLPQPATYEEAAKLLQKYPPRCADMDSRSQALAGLDNLLKAADSEDSEACGNYYNQRVKQVIEEIRAWNSPTPKLWHLYSSGILVKTQGKVLAFDVNCGVEWEYTNSHRRKYKLNLNDENLEALSDLIDKSYHTHEHSDHTGYDLLQKLVAKGKQVFMTGDAITYYHCEKFPNVIRAEAHHEPGYWVFNSTQRMGTFLVQNTAFVVELVPGTNLLVRGDIYDPQTVAHMCDAFQSQGAYAHYASVSPGADVLPECHRRWKTFILSSHEWEFTHRPAGQPGVACQSFSGNYNGIYNWYIGQGDGEVLSWGESIELPPRKEIPQPQEPWMKLRHYSRYFNDYRTTITSKIYLKSKGSKDASTTLDQAMELIRTIHDVTGGMHQIIYLVGWQFDGHDSKYPSWDEVGAHCASSFSKDPRESLRMMMREAKKRYNADVSLHINMNDAYENSPTWKEYVERDAIAKTQDGKLRKGGVWGGEQCYYVSHTKELRSGLAKERIQRLLQLLPELRDSATIHIDALFGVASPYDKISLEDDIAAIHAITDLWYAEGIDVTTEFLASYVHLGYFPMVFHNNLNECDRLKYPPEFICGGNDAWHVKLNADYYRPAREALNNRPSDGCRYWQPWGSQLPYDMGSHNLDRKPQFIEEIFRRPVMACYFGQFRPVSHTVTSTHYTVNYTRDVTASVDMQTNLMTVTQDGHVVADGTDVMLPMAQDGMAYILAYTQKGMTRTIHLPSALAIKKKLTMTRPLGGKPIVLPVTDGKVTLTLAAREVGILR